MELNIFKGVPSDRLASFTLPSQEGTWGSGYYFANTRDCAEAYSGDGVVIVATAQPTNPYYFAAPNVDHDLPGMDLVKEIFDSDHASSIIDAVVRDRGFYFGREIQTELASRGHDALIVTYHEGSQEIVLYDLDSVVCKAVFDQSGDDVYPQYLQRSWASTLGFWLCRHCKPNAAA